MFKDLIVKRTRLNSEELIVIYFEDLIVKRMRFNFEYLIIILFRRLTSRLPNSYPSKYLPTKFNTTGCLPGKILVHKNGIVCNNLPGKR